MFRMTAFALAAAASIAVTAAAPTSASAADGWRSDRTHSARDTNWRNDRRHHSWGHRHFRSRVTVRYSAPYYAYARPYYAYAPYCFTKKRWVHTHWGWQVRRIRICR